MSEVIMEWEMMEMADDGNFTLSLSLRRQETARSKYDTHKTTQKDKNINLITSLDLINYIDLMNYNFTKIQRRI